MSLISKLRNLFGNAYPLLVLCTKQDTIMVSGLMNSLQFFSSSSVHYLKKSTGSVSSSTCLTGPFTKHRVGHIRTISLSDARVTAFIVRCVPDSIARTLSGLELDFVAEKTFQGNRPSIRPWFWYPYS